MHGPVCIFWADLTPSFSPQVEALGRRRERDQARLVTGGRVLESLSSDLHRHMLNHIYTAYIFEHAPMVVGT